MAARAVSSAGRAPALHAGGRRFESCTAHAAAANLISPFLARPDNGDAARRRAALTSPRSWRNPVRLEVNRLLRSSAFAVTIVWLTAAAGCQALERTPYHPSGLYGGEAVALLQREAERRGITRVFARAEKVETQTPSGTDAWLVRLVSEADSGDLCGYVWRGEEAGRAFGTVIRTQFDQGCRHWPR